ncbi:MAG TPA: DUF1800 domain-containing protein [Ramlibacter sp.]|nr:DUF1800 domain-containing protein [Ramlibacter sp.]
MKLFSCLAIACAAIAPFVHAAPARMSADEARHLLIRTGFVPSAGEVRAFEGRSAEQAVDDVISAARRAQPLHALPPEAISAPPAAVAQKTMSRDERQMARREQIREGFGIKEWWMREMVESPTPLAERLTLFWHGHFATSQQKVVRADAMWRQHELLRANAMGSFRDMLHGIARDPAMLVYLDGARNRKEAPNENFAREVMELFTLGEATQGGGYTEGDIREVARAFTGWSLERDDLSFRFRPAMHDFGTKTVLGHTGSFDGDQVLDILLDQPQAARFIVEKLWVEFVSPTPDPREVERIAQRFRSTNYDIAVAMRELLLSREFWDAANRNSLVKSPVELVVGAVRELGIRPQDVRPMVQKSAQLGQNLLVPPNVKGWPGYTEWINATTLLERRRFADQLVAYVPGDAQRMAAFRQAAMDPGYQLK